MTIEDFFNRSADYYDGWLRKAVPTYDDVFGTAVELIPFDPKAEIRVLDLGAGTGLFAWHVMQRFPRARFVLYDLSSQMLEVASERFAEVAERVSIIQTDYLRLDAVDTYDAIISSFSIHHLYHSDKQRLFSLAHRALKPSGAFVNIDQIEAPTPALKDLYWNSWLEKVRSAGADEAQVQESIRRRSALDNDASLADQLRWLTDAGFTDVDCIYKHFFVGVFYGRKHPATDPRPTSQ